MFNNPCKACFRSGDCDRYTRCIRWRVWFAKEWQRLQVLMTGGK